MPIPFRQETLRTIRQRIGYLLYGRARFITGTVVSSASGFQFVLNEAKRVLDQQLVGLSVYVTSGTGAGQFGRVVSNIASTGTVSVLVAFSPQLDNTSVVELWPEDLTPLELNNKINDAILRVSDLVGIPLTDTPNALVLDGTTVIGLDLKTTFYKVAAVRLLTTGNEVLTYRAASWLDKNAGNTFQLDTGGLARLWLYPPQDSNTYPIANWHVAGYRLPAALSADTDLAEVPAQYLVLWTAAMLDAGQAEGPTLDPEQHAGRAANWLREAAAIESRLSTDWLPGTINVPW